MAILIDGFNLIYKFPELEQLMYQGRLTEARTGLLNRLKEFQKITGVQIRVVLDGKKQESLDLKRERVGKIDVYYSIDFSADYLIKQFIKKDMNPRMATVVTSDKDIIDFVLRFKAKVKKSEDFAKHVEETIKKMLEEQIPEKEDDPVVSDDEIAYWESEFNGPAKKK